MIMNDTSKELLKGSLGLDKIGSEVSPQKDQTWKCLKCGNDVLIAKVHIEMGVRPLSWLCWCVDCATEESKRLEKLFNIQ